MSQPGQFELQLGHLCNDRCVFCVSGYLTSEGKAPLLDASELMTALDGAWAAGHRRVTLLGGEPTIQPYFLDVVRHAAALGFEIVVFSNGSKPGRTALVDEVAASGAEVEWRFSFQGGTREAHERTTRRRGSFDQLLRAVSRVSALGQRITVNTCVVRQNGESLGALPALLAPFGVAQVHVDMVNPYDTGLLHEDTGEPAVGPVASAPGDPRRIDASAALAALQPRYSDLREPLTRMIAGFPSDFDVNIGNLPYCIAPSLAPWIHHGGQRTWTLVANDRGRGELGHRRLKYHLKQAFKSKPEGCRRCVFDERCSGVFDSYAAQYGTGELVPVSEEAMSSLDRGQLFALRTSAFLRRALEGATLPAGVRGVTLHERGRDEVGLVFDAEDGELALALRPDAGGMAATDRFSIHVERGSSERLGAALAFVWRAALDAGAQGVHPPGPDASSTLPASVAAGLARLRRAAPFGTLRWEDLHDRGGRRGGDAGGAGRRSRGGVAARRRRQAARRLSRGRRGRLAGAGRRHPPRARGPRPPPCCRRRLITLPLEPLRSIPRASALS